MAQYEGQGEEGRWQLAYGLRPDPAVLAGTPFSDWRVPGVLLAGLVGGGFLLAGWWQWRGHRYARGLSVAAGAGLVCFESAVRPLLPQSLG